ncbi:MAG: pyrroline-5-carboxylate reductase [bacterium]
MRIGFAGCGKMAEAMATGLIAAGIVRPSQICGSDTDRRRLSSLKRRHGIKSCATNRDLLSSADVIFIAVKPHQMQIVLEEIRSAASNKHLIISIAAGIPVSFIESILDHGRIVRVMPNMPCLVSSGMSVFTLGTRATSADRATVCKLLGSFGVALELPENVFDAVTALSGSGPAFFSFVLDKMAQGAMKTGLNRRTALLLAEQTMLGTAKLLIDRGIDPGELVASVATPNGTTAAGLNVLEKRGTAGALTAAVKAAARRCLELAPGAPPAIGTRKKGKPSVKN